MTETGHTAADVNAICMLTESWTRSCLCWLGYDSLRCERRLRMMLVCSRPCLQINQKWTLDETGTPKLFPYGPIPGCSSMGPDVYFSIFFSQRGTSDQYLYRSTAPWQCLLIHYFYDLMVSRWCHRIQRCNTRVFWVSERTLFTALSRTVLGKLPPISCNKDNFAFKNTPNFYQLKDRPTFQKIPPIYLKIGEERENFKPPMAQKCMVNGFFKGHWTFSASSPDFFQKSLDFYTVRSVYLCSDCMLNLCNFNSITKIG